MAEQTYTFSTSSYYLVNALNNVFAVLFNTGSNKVYLDSVKINSKVPGAITGLHQIFEIYKCTTSGSAFTGSLNVFSHDTTNQTGIPVVGYTQPASIPITGLQPLVAYNLNTDEAAQIPAHYMYNNDGSSYCKRIVLNQNEGLAFVVGARAAGTSSFAPYITINTTV